MHNSVMSETGKRLKALMKNRDVNQSGLSKSTGVQQSTIQRILSGAIESPKTKHLIPIADYLNVSLNYLIGIDAVKGEGDARDFGEIHEKLKSVIFFESIEDLPVGEFVQVNKVNIEVAAGDGCINGDLVGLGKPIAFRSDWIKGSKARSTNLIVVEVKGDSMSPTLCNDDDALIDLDQNEIKNGLVYAFVSKGEAYIKRLYKHDEKIIAHSDNNNDPKYKYDNEYNESDQISIIGRVVNRSGSGNL